MFRISNIPAPQKTAPVLLCARTAANIRLNTTPSEYDYEVPEKALVEVTVECLGQEFSFHMPLDKITECGYVISSLERKVWINSTDFHHSLLLKFEPHIKELLSHVSE